MTASAAPGTVRFGDVAAESVRQLASTPGRSVLSALGVALGIGAFVLLFGLQATNEDALRSSVALLRSTRVNANVVVGAGTPVSPRTLSDWRDASARAGAVTTAVSWRLDASTPVLADVRGGARTRSTATVVAVDQAGIDQLGLTVDGLTPGAAATLVDRAPACLVGSVLAGKLGIRAGATLWINGRSWSVVGVVRDSRARPDLLFSVLVGARPALERSWVPQVVELALTTPPGDAAAVASRLPLAVDPAHPRRVVALTVPDAGVLADRLDQRLVAGSAALGAAALVLGLFFISMSSYVSVLERQGEIALRRSLGARPRDISLQIVSEAVLVGLAGAAAGAVLGALGVVVSARVRDLPVPWSPGGLLLALAVGVVGGAVASIAPAWRASKVDPIVFLRRL